MKNSISSVFFLEGVVIHFLSSGVASPLAPLQGYLQPRLWPRRSLPSSHLLNLSTFGAAHRAKFFWNFPLIIFILESLILFNIGSPLIIGFHLSFSPYIHKSAEHSSFTYLDALIVENVLNAKKNCRRKFGSFQNDKIKLFQAVQINITAKVPLFQWIFHYNLLELSMVQRMKLCYNF